MKTIGTGIDTLCVGYGTRFYHLSLKALKLAKKDAQAERNSRGVPVHVCGYDFSMMPRGSNGYEYTLMNQDVTVNLATNIDGGKMMPEIYVKYSASLLAKNGLDNAIKKVNAMVQAFGDIVNEKVSRVDIRHDAEMKMPNIDLLNNVVSRARTKTSHISNLETHMKGRHITGYSIGKGDLMCRIYDKTEEIEKTGKHYFHDLWKQQGWEGGQVVRTEFQLRREVLKQFGINTTADLKNTMPDLWKYCTDQWLRIVENSEDTNVNRWKVSDYWKMVQAAVITFGDILGLLKYRTRKTNLERLYQQMIGCAKSAVAIMAKDKNVGRAAVILEREIRKTMESIEFKDGAFSRVPLYSSI